MVSQTLKSTLISQIASLSNPKTAGWWENYVKHDTKFRGVGIPVIREELKKWYITANISGLSLDYQLDLALSFFEEEYSEDKLAGILFLQLYLYDKFDYKTLLSRFVQLFEKGLIYDWNICDWFCVRVLGPMIVKNGMDCAVDISKWNCAENVWLARCSVVAFANIAKDGSYTDILIESMRKLILREERFAKTAVGWILREISRNDKATVSDFVRDHFAHFSKESLENSIKYFTNEEKKLLRRKPG
ncbi:MAG TPA: DNA alkylation repair protein [Mesotoga sp.]|nr:DNA alkylation repair protein [Mesotoga sp.]HQQ57449.1 DNA alkylation repair protein [Mesotoga sp.]